MTPSESNSYHLNRQIHNEKSKNTVIVGQGQVAKVTIGDSESQDSGQPAPDPILYPPSGYSVDERIYNTDIEGMTVFGQGSGARTQISERFAAMLLHSQMSGSVQEDQQREQQESRREREFQQAQQAWERERAMLQQALMQQAWELRYREKEIELLEREIAHLQQVMRQLVSGSSIPSSSLMNGVDLPSRGYDDSRMNDGGHRSFKRDQYHDTPP